MSTVSLLIQPEHLNIRQARFRF